MLNHYVAIIAGGKGERFWPKSRLSKPKHLLNIVGNEPLILQTLHRAQTLTSLNHIFIVTNLEQKEPIQQICTSIPPDHVIAEPEPKDTAAAIALACALVYKKDPEAILTILPADHAIQNLEKFTQTLQSAAQLAEKNTALVVLGIPPTHPSTHYGYIAKGEKLLEVAIPTYKVEKFVEKPQARLAQDYFESNHYYWNAGMFVAKAKTLQSLFAQHSSAHADFIQEICTQNLDNASLDPQLKKLYPALPKIAFDYAIVEKAQNILCIEAQFDWDDVGEWHAMKRHFPADVFGNIIQGNAILQDCENNLVINSEGHLTAMIGLKDLVVVQTPDATLICHKDKTDEIKNLIKEIKNSPYGETVL